ncbi:hypothetical protein [uncultured Desulfovibrio sp.]|uniref:hypothetical protein n=1 Tax=uncultured Desulfovibrio sp. TaxID=167968 RepID=UPI002627EF61|nr:hypothetical protein [uncultured Desulfovibrio sp.]
MDTAEILRQKQLCVAVHLRKPRFAWQRKRAFGAPFGWLRRWLRQKKIFLVEYLSTLPAKIFLFLASAERSYFFGFFRHQHPSVASLQTDLRMSINCSIQQGLCLGARMLVSCGATGYDERSTTFRS